MIQRGDPADSKSPAPIPNQALFCDCRACGGTVCATPFLEEPDEKKITIR